MSWVNSKNAIIKISDRLIAIADIYSFNNTADKIRKFQQAMVEDLFIVTVVGEFNRGKSTLINAIIGCDVIPTSIRPTTATINIIYYSEDPIIEVHRVTGEIDRVEFSKESFQEYTALSDFDASTVKYVRVGYPVDYLKDGTIIVDTPGVNDINEQRLTITYGYLPNSDAVVFLMNASTPFKSTEKEFLETHVIGNKVKKVFFLANRIDELSSTEVNESVTDIRTQLKGIIMSDDYKVYPVSSKLALKGVVLNDNELTKESMIDPFTADLKNFLNSPDKIQIKLDRLKIQLTDLINLLTDDVDMAIAQNQLNGQELSTAIQKLEIKESSLEDAYKRLIQYIKDNELTLERNIENSLLKSIQELNENLLYQVERARGDLTEFAQRDIPFIVKKHINQWHDSTQPKITQFINAIQQKAILGFTEHFSKKPIISALIVNYEHESLSDSMMPVNQSINSSDRIKKIKQTSFIIGAASLGLLATIATGGIGYPALMAVFGGGSIGQRFLGEKWTNEEIEKQRAELRRNIPVILQEIYERFHNGLSKEIQHKFNHFVSELDREFKMTLTAVKDELKLNAANKSRQIDAADLRTSDFNKTKEEINNMLSALEDL